MLDDSKLAFMLHSSFYSAAARHQLRLEQVRRYADLNPSARSYILTLIQVPTTGANNSSTKYATNKLCLLPDRQQ